MLPSRLPIFMFHNIGTPPPGAGLPRLYVDAETFDRQCRLIRRLGLRGVHMSEGLRELRTGRARRLVTLSFDDGYADTLECAAPILARHGFSAICYVVTGAVGSYNSWDADTLRVRKPLMDAAAIRRWLQAGHEIGSHTVSHPVLTKLSRAEAAREISSSRTELERMAGVQVIHFCYPYGDHDARIVELARTAGYESAVTTRRGAALQADDPLCLPRIAINRGQSLVKFALHAATPYSWLRRQ